ncbi:hypothetical protein HHK36_011469 [Tetracentron sinense]|uniref:Uncharacterized protein n=1 Tax=Tetracentron sinense TaxID=13715 RepID=A0A835DJX0_TETSI|nr:hypothetical protein HHK36_011469 [Tetracentron sinense]
MAFRSYVVVLLVVALCLVVMEGASSECSSGYGCFYAEAAPKEIQSRKLLHNSEEVFRSTGSMGNRDGGDLVGWDLRRAPSGPDPLHHNGGGPKKPQTP